jgi:hypothetical protein
MHKTPEITRLIHDNLWGMAPAFKMHPIPSRGRKARRSKTSAHTRGTCRHHGRVAVLLLLEEFREG